MSTKTKENLIFLQTNFFVLNKTLCEGWFSEGNPVPVITTYMCTKFHVTSTSNYARWPFEMSIPCYEFRDG